jgi:serine/threonine-protein kinase
LNEQSLVVDRFEPAAGMCVSHNLRLVRPLGSGAMASVWVAEHRTLGIERAVKFLSPELSEDDTVAERFDREAKAIARINSPHVVEVFDNGCLDCGIPFIVTELLRGEDLAELITREGALSLEETVALVTQVARALDAAHALGIVHRDLKPGNIFVSAGEDGPSFKVLDFGIAKAPEERGEDRITITKTGHAMGTPGFMSPEQWLNAKGVDPRSDLWALGAVAYCALTDEVPFDAESPAKAMFATCSGDLPPASDFDPDIPPELDAWFAKAMARRPEDRFESAAQMARTFSAIVAERRERLSFSSRPTTMIPERLVPWPEMDEHEAGPPSVAPVASTVPPPASAGSAARLAWRKRARTVARTVIGALTATALLGAVGVGTMYERGAQARAKSVLVRSARSSVVITGTTAQPTDR